MPRYRVIEYHTYTVTFDVEAATADAAQDAVGAMTMDEGEEEELGCDDVDVTLIDSLHREHRCHAVLPALCPLGSRCA
jgi:hypothetical protein